MRVLGVDSASQAGWAIVDGERLIEHGTIDARDSRRVHQLVGDICVRLRPDLAVIEDAYVARGAHANVATSMLLARLIGRWEMALSMRGVPTELLVAEAWQSQVLAGLCPARAKRDVRKAAAARWVLATYRVVVGEDAGDAIGLATFVSRRETFAARLRRAG